MPDARRKLFEAMCRIAETGKGHGGAAREHGLLDQMARVVAAFASPGIIGLVYFSAEAAKSPA